LKVNTVMAAGLESAHWADHLFSGPDPSDSSVRGEAKPMFISAIDRRDWQTGRQGLPTNCPQPL